MYVSFCEKEEKEKKSIDEEMKAENFAYANGLELKNIDNPYEWSAKTVNENYTVLLAAQGNALNPNAHTAAILDLWEIPHDYSENVIRVYTGKMNIYSADNTLEENYRGKFTGHTDRIDEYEINSAEDCTILIDDIEHCLKQEGLNIVVYDNNYRVVLDSVAITQSENGELFLQR